MAITTEYIYNKLKEIINVEITPSDYTFIETNKELSNIILMGLGGSYAYGTNIEGSDIDLRGIALNSRENILLGKDFEQVVNTDTDTTIYSLNKMMTLLMNCNPNTIEIVGLKPEQYIYISDIGKKLIENKDMFLSKRCINSFMGYANQQMYRLQQKSVVAMSEAKLNAHIVKTINFMTEVLEKQYNMTGIKFHLNDAGNIVVDFNIDNYPADDFSAVLGIINKTLRDYHKNSVRNEKALAHNKINKHAMHLLRLYMMCEDILRYGEINTYRENEHDLLMAIRNGYYTGEDGKPNEEFYNIVHLYEKRIEVAKGMTKLPDKKKIKKINEFIIMANSTVM